MGYTCSYGKHTCDPLHINLMGVHVAMANIHVYNYARDIWYNRILMGADTHTVTMATTHVTPPIQPRVHKRARARYTCISLYLHTNTMC